jgi:hypothetical protein
MLAESSLHAGIACPPVHSVEENSVAAVRLTVIKLLVGDHPDKHKRIRDYSKPYSSVSESPGENLGGISGWDNLFVFWKAGRQGK